jgi:hypothetical protein
MRRIYLPLHLILAALFIFVCNFNVFADGVVIKLTNKSNKEVILSDFYVFNAQGQKQTRLAPGNSSDDIKVGPGGVQLLDLDFKPTRYIVSTKEGNSEPETEVFNIDLVTPKKVSMLLNSTNGSPLFLAIDQSLSNFEPPPDGAILAFSLGVNPNFPGWFVGTMIDSEGIISGAFTGDALVASTIEVVAVPEPATLFLLSSGIAGIAMKLRWRKQPQLH